MSHPILNTIATLDKIIESRKQSNAELQSMASDLLASISKIQAVFDSPIECIADLDIPCDCPKCLIHAATMEAEYDAGKLDPKEEIEECPHFEHDHYVCMDCGEDRMNHFIGMAEDACEGER